MTDTDLVERLRRYTRNLGGRAEDYLTWKAADEIERLQTALEYHVSELQATRREIDRLRAVMEPFMQFYADIRFNLRKQPHPNECAVHESGERTACIRWADFYALSEALTGREGRE